jgi:CheY-like chemotaxis protein
MDEETRQRIFDPFFTTKSGERGSGLGLSSCRAIVTEAGGHMDVVSVPGRETTFHVYLPVAPSVESRPSKPPEIEPHVAAGETILILDDEPDVRRVMVEALQSRGYKVLEASHGPDALTLLEEHDEIALLITDLVLPLMSGEKVREQTLRIRPELPVLIVTGFTHSVPHQDDITGYLGKPFAIQELLQAVAQLLTRRPTDPNTSV